MTPHPRFRIAILALAAIGMIPAIGLFAAPTAAPAVPAPVALKIATVDTQELFKQYYRTNEAQKQINVDRAKIQKDNNERMAKIREIETSLGKLSKQLEDTTINDSKKQLLFKDWQAQQQEGIALDRERREFLQRRNQLLNEQMLTKMKGILEEIRKLVEEYAKGESFDDFHGWSHQRIAIDGRISVKAVESKLARLRKRLRQHLCP
jgi:Skp family chaperone for outer membrane proteins